MITTKHFNVRNLSFILFIFSLVIITACSAQTLSITPNPIPTNIKVLPNATPTNTLVPPSPTPTIQPSPDLNEWDLLIISDSSNWGVGQYYANLIETDLGVKVNLHDCWVGGLDISQALDTLQRGGSLRPHYYDQYCLRPWREIIKEAEVMVLFGAPVGSNPPDGSWDIPESWFSCYLGGYEEQNLKSGFETYKDNMLNSCNPETFVLYKANIGAFLDEIDKIREGRPLILRMTDLYIATHSLWLEAGINEVCVSCVKNFSNAIRQVAEEHGVPLADTMIAFSGENYLSDPPTEYFGKYDEVHLSDEGAQFVATLLQQTGYEYSGK